MLSLINARVENILALYCLHWGQRKRSLPDEQSAEQNEFSDKIM
jgi:hypothetical protein